MNSYIIDFLNKLCNIPSPSGFADKAMDFIEEELSKLEVFSFRTRKGSLIATIPGKNLGAKKLIVVHADTSGAMVKGIKSNGIIDLAMVGECSFNSFGFENVKLFAYGGKEYEGTIYFNENSIYNNQENRQQEQQFEDMELILDERVNTEEDVRNLGIEIGDFISFDSRFRVTNSGYIKSYHLDNKIGVASIIAAIKAIKEDKEDLEDTIQILISNYGEVGHGSSYSLNPSIEEILCVGVRPTEIGQNEDEYGVIIGVKDGTGPYDYYMKNNLIDIAKKNNIFYKPRVLTLCDSNARAMLRAGNDIRFGFIGPGIYKSNSYKRTNIKAIDATVALLVAYMKDDKNYSCHVCKCGNK